MSTRKKRKTGHSGKKHRTKHHFLHGLSTGHAGQHPVMHSALETGKDLLVGVVGGGLAGAALGKSSLLYGILVTGAGHYFSNRYVQLVGIGMMASNGFQKSSSGTTNGLEGIDGIKDRLLAYKDSFSEKFYLDKFLKRKSLVPSSTPIGDVQYFTYPEAMGDLAALNDIEQQLAQSALSFQGTIGGDQSDMSGDFPEIAGDLPDSNMGDMDDRLY